MTVRPLTPASRIASISAVGNAAQAEAAGHDRHAVAQQPGQRRHRIRIDLVDRHARASTFLRGTVPLAGGCKRSKGQARAFALATSGRRRCFLTVRRQISARMRGGELGLARRIWLHAQAAATRRKSDASPSAQGTAGRRLQPASRAIGSARRTAWVCGAIAHAADGHRHLPTPVGTCALSCRGRAVQVRQCAADRPPARLYDAMRLTSIVLHRLSNDTGRA